MTSSDLFKILQMGKHTGGEGLPQSRRNPRRAQRGSANLISPERGGTARQVVQWFHRSGCPAAEIERRTELPHSFVHRWTHRKDTRTQPGRGPQKPIGTDLLPALKKEVCKKRFKSANRIRPLVVNPSTHKMVAKSTMCDALDRAGLMSVKMEKTPKLLQSHKDRRLAFAKKYKEKDIHNWIWTDEKIGREDTICVLEAFNFNDACNLHRLQCTVLRVLLAL